MLSRLESFIEKHLFFVNYVLFLTYLKHQMKINTQNINILNEEDLDNSTIFYDVFSAIKVFKAALENMKKAQTKSERELTILETVATDYMSLFERLDKELKFKLRNYFKQKKKKEQAASQ